MIDLFKDWAEALTIRFLHILHATSFKKRPGLCPPQCSEGHMYKWPCRARIKRAKKSKVGAHRDKRIGTWDSVEETPEGLIAKGRLQQSEAWHRSNPNLGKTIKESVMDDPDQQLDGWDATFKGFSETTEEFGNRIRAFFKKGHKP